MNFQDKKVTVIGDIMLDAYYLGEVKRMAQEALCPTFELHKVKYCLGAAANVALCAKRVGCDVELIGVMGQDTDGNTLFAMLEDEKIFPKVVFQENTCTNIKSRYCDTRTYHQVFRHDIIEQGPNESEKALLVEQVKESVQDTDVVLISDYGKGVISHEVMECLKDLKGTFIGIDPHPANRLSYACCDADLFTPNEPEALSMGWKVGDAFWGPGDYLIVTRGKAGMYARNAQEDSEHELPANTLHPICVVGAGDVVVTVGSLLLSSGSSLHDAVAISNHAAGNAVRRPFTSSIFPYDLKVDEKQSLIDQGV